MGGKRMTKKLKKSNEEIGGAFYSVDDSKRKIKTSENKKVP